MLQGITRFAIAAPANPDRRPAPDGRRGVYGAPVMDSLSAGGIRNPDVGILARVEDAGRQVRPGRYATDRQRSPPTLARKGIRPAQSRTDLVAQLERFPFVTQVHSAWTAPPAMARSMISEDGRTGLIIAGITGGENGAQRNGRELLPLLHDRDGVTVRAGRRGDDLHRGQRPEQARPAAHGGDRAAAELRGPGLGVRRRAGRGGPARGRRLGDRRLDGGPARCSPRSPRCRSSRSTSAPPWAWRWRSTTRC